MQQMGQYVVSVVSAAMISGILLSFFREGSLRTLMQLCCGVLLTITVLCPLTNLSGFDLNTVTDSCFSDGKIAAEQGKRQAEEETKKRIQDALEEYIGDKASQLGASITADISLDPSGVPVHVQLEGSDDQSLRQKMQLLITNDLGIPKENQEWIGNPP